MTGAAALSLASALLTALGPAGTAMPAATPPAIEVIAHVRSGAGVNPACLREAVTGFLAGRGIPVHWPAGDASPATRAPAPARRLSLDIDLTDPARAALTFTDAAGGSPQVRALALQHGLDPVGCELLADVIEASVLAMTAAPAAAPPAPASVAATTPAAADAPASLTPPILHATRPDAAFRDDRTALAIAYTLEPAASDILQSGVELAFGSRPAALRRRNWIRVSYAFPVTASVDGVSARWQTLSATWVVSVSSRGRHAWFELGSGFGLNLTFVETRMPAATGSIAADSRTQVGPTFGSDVTVAVRVAPSAVLYASLRLPVIASPPVALEANGRTVFESWWFRPALVVGGRWE